MNVSEGAQQLLLQVKMGEDTGPTLAGLGNLPLPGLQAALKTDDQKKAFWINLYNAGFLILRKEKGLAKPAIYRDKALIIAGQNFSLDDIEHGVLRKYRYKFSLGYLPNIFASRLIKQLAVSQIDYRIHFALNCGARSCPPIAFYKPDKIEQQLEMATLSFLEGDTIIDEANKEIKVSQLFQWFKGDFGGNAGTKKILSEKLKINAWNYKLSYQPYSWEEHLDNFVE